MKKQIILDKIIFSLQKKGGISRYFKELLDFMLNGTNYNNIRIVNKFNNGPKLYYYIKLILPSLFFSMRHKVWHSSYFRIAFGYNLTSITTVHDLLAFRYPEYLSRALFQRFLIKRSVKRSEVIICISDFTKKELIHFIPSSEKKKLIVLKHFVSDLFYFKDLVREDFLLFIGSRAKYKNFEDAIVLTSALNKELVIVGNSLNNQESTLLANSNLSYRLLKNTSDQELNTLYNSCWAFVQLSIYEGFGIPLIEASRCGAACIVQDLEYSREVLNKSGYFFNKSILNNKNELNKFKNCIDLDNICKIAVEERIKKSLEYTKKSWQKSIYDLHINI